MTKLQRAMAERFSKGRISVQDIPGPADEGFALRFLVRIGGRIVAPMSMPNQGYRSRREARADGAAFKRACVVALRHDRY